MRYLPGSKKVFDRLLQSIFQAYKKTWVQFGVVPMLLTVPMGLMLAYYGNEYFRVAVEQNFPEIDKFLVDHVLFIVVALSLIPIAAQALGHMAVKRIVGRGLNVQGLLALFASIDQVVGAKAARFAKIARDPQGITCESAFATITQPTLQIDELVRGVCDLFNATRSGDNRALIRVVLATTSNGAIKDVPVYFPRDEPVGTPLQVLNSRFSSMRISAESGRIVVISSIRSELRKGERRRRFAQSPHEQDNSGSLICYPICVRELHPKPLYVLSVHCEEDGYFKPEFSELYEHSLERFGLRIRLEHCLLTLRERICERKQ